ncbi:hypothetical protein TNCV_1580011 [Trichonephila clavipes]|nr:hypothetical protein TNCV_1580011 [Trichonephila clavipes]
MHARVAFGAISRPFLIRYPNASAQRWVFVTFFPSRNYSTVRSRLGDRGTMTTTFYRGRTVMGVRILYSVEHYSYVRSRLVARGTIISTSYRRRAAVGVRHFFRRGTTLLSGRGLVQTER